MLVLSNLPRHTCPALLLVLSFFSLKLLAVLFSFPKFQLLPSQHGSRLRQYKREKGYRVFRIKMVLQPLPNLTFPSRSASFPPPRTNRVRTAGEIVILLLPYTQVPSLNLWQCFTCIHSQLQCRDHVLQGDGCMSHAVCTGLRPAGATATEARL